MRGGVCQRHYVGSGVGHQRLSLECMGGFERWVPALEPVLALARAMRHLGTHWERHLVKHLSRPRTRWAQCVSRTHLGATVQEEGPERWENSDE